MAFGTRRRSIRRRWKREFSFAGLMTRAYRMAGSGQALSGNLRLASGNLRQRTGSLHLRVRWQRQLSPKDVPPLYQRRPMACGMKWRSIRRQLTPISTFAGPKVTIRRAECRTAGCGRALNGNSGPLKTSANVLRRTGCSHARFRWRRQLSPKDVPPLYLVAEPSLVSMNVNPMNIRVINRCEHHPTIQPTVDAQNSALTVGSISRK